jgi:hypothetical protein
MQHSSTCKGDAHAVNGKVVSMQSNLGRITAMLAAMWHWLHAFCSFFV